MRDTLCVELQDLPARAHKLTSDELTQVFGGGGNHCEACDMGKNEEYCNGDLYCRGNDTKGWYCIHWGENTTEACGA